ncbi:hypothetical protein DY000_02001940 [Brassica cretica]|uniref:Reverse transcriptase zinc-binding domain-containing protein n=1 Tax=Brassica cretica TaxID=69181 RepID=A0ABQ7C1L1_BRACR|nr:hypothetical protein DY000_02001940 [Brassica cretica]
MEQAEIEMIKASTGMSCGSLPFRYLGVPLNSRKLSIAGCDTLLQQVKAKFNSCTFLWKGDTDSGNSARETVTLTKEQGGLGVKDLLTWNKSCCLRLIWMIFFGLEWENGHDNWSPFGCLYDYLDARLGIPLSATVASLSRNGAWSLPPARSEHQLNLLSYLTTIQLTDSYYWEIEGTPMLRYETGRIYNYLRGNIDSVQWASAVWSPRSIPRHSFHACFDLNWSALINQMTSLPPPRSKKLLCLLANTFRTVDSLLKTIDLQIRNQIPLSL